MLSPGRWFPLGPCWKDISREIQGPEGMAAVSAAQWTCEAWGWAPRSCWPGRAPGPLSPMAFNSLVSLIKNIKTSRGSEFSGSSVTVPKWT